MSIFGFYYYLGQKAGDAFKEAAIDASEAKESWKDKGINPVDSIKQKVIKQIDSLNEESKIKDSISDTD